MSIIRKHKIYNLLNNKPTGYVEKGFVYIEDILDRLKMHKRLRTSSALYYHIDNVFYMEKNAYQIIIRQEGFVDVLIRQYKFTTTDFLELFKYLLNKKFGIKETDYDFVIDSVGVLKSLEKTERKFMIR